MKQLTLVLLLFLSVLFGNASSADPDSVVLKRNAWASGPVYVALGTGLGNIDLARGREPDKRITTQAYTQRSGVVPLFLKLELPIAYHLGLTFTLNRTSLNYTYDTKAGAETMDWTVLTANFRVNYHFFYKKPYDLYVGTGTGIRNERYHYHFSDGTSAELKLESPVLLGFEATVGFRYNLLGPFGLYAEAGIARTVLQFGFYVNPIPIRN